MGDEGGFAPPIHTIEEGLGLLVDAIESAGYTGRIDIALDAAASEFYKNGSYDLDFKTPGVSRVARVRVGVVAQTLTCVCRRQSSNVLSAEGLADIYVDMVDKYPIISIEDPFDQVQHRRCVCFAPVSLTLLCAAVGGITQDDWAGWQALTARVGSRCQIVGDDLLVCCSVEEGRSKPLSRAP